jgi:hypothetical protein
VQKFCHTITFLKTILLGFILPFMGHKMNDVEIFKNYDGLKYCIIKYLTFFDSLT